MATINLGRTITRTTASPLLRRLRLRHGALPLGIGVGLTTGLVAAHRQQPMQFDSLAVPAPAQTRTAASGRNPKQKELLDPETIKQLSGGSLSGMLLPSIFQPMKLLVLFFPKFLFP